MSDYQFVIVAQWPGGRKVNVLVDVEPPVDSAPTAAPPSPKDTKGTRPSRHNMDAMVLATPESLRSFITEITAPAPSEGNVYALCFEPRLRRLYLALGLREPPAPGSQVPLAF